MSWETAVSGAADALPPHLMAVALISARLVPLAFMSPLFGGAQAPTHVRLSVVLSLAMFLHAAAGVSSPVVVDAFDLLAAGARELLLGIAMGLVAGLPFDGARIAGRFIDVFRGSSAEASLPLVGSSDSAGADVLHQVLLAMSASSAAYPLVISAIAKSFGVVGLGMASPSGDGALFLAQLVGTTFATGIAVAAPTLGVSFAVDAALGLASRAAPSLNLNDASAPLRIFGGAAVFWLTLGVLAERCLTAQLSTADAFNGLFGATP